MHIKYYDLLKLLWHAINIKGWLQGRCNNARLPQWDGSKTGGLSSCLCWECAPRPRPQARALRTLERLPQHHSVQRVQSCTTTWCWLSGCKALLIFLCSYLQLTLHLGCPWGPWRICTLVCSADEKTDEAKIQLNLRSLPPPVVLGG